MKHITQRKVVIALGANLPGPGGGPSNALDAAFNLLECEDLHLQSKSDYFHSAAFPKGSGPDFVNGAALFASGLPPDAILDRLHGIERDLGRSRKHRWEARAIDLDLIAMDDMVLPDVDTFRTWRDLALDRQMLDAPSELILPHPRLQDRAFVLLPMLQVAPEWRHPVSGESVHDMLKALPKADVDDVQPLTNLDFG